MTKIRVAARDEIGPGQVRTCFVGRRRIALVCTNDGELHALADNCPHQQAPLAGGRLEFMIDADDAGRYRMTDTQVLRCPWHGYEFDLESGLSLADPERMRVRSYAVSVEGDDIYVERETAPPRAGVAREPSPSE